MVAFNDLRYKKILVAVKREYPRPQLLRDVSEGIHPVFTDDFFTKIKRQTIAFGGGVDDMAHLCEWIVDEPGGAEDDPDHWMNLRPY